MSHRRNARAVVALAVATTALAATLAPPAYAGNAISTPAAKLAWAPCPEGTADGPSGARLECAKVRVPLDHRRPEGRQLAVTISRLPSPNPEARRGVLLVNPGGPGDSGLGMPAQLAELGAPASLLDRYDLIGFDPRGVGHSAPVACGFTADQPYRRSDPPYARSSAEVAAYARIAKQAADRCLRGGQAETLRHLSTTNTARDLDRVRAALGEPKVSYYGASYGSGLGATYATLFAERTDRVVLDSNLGDTTQTRETFRRMGLGAEQRFPDLAAYVANRHGTYGLGRTPAAVRRGYFDLARKLDAAPVAGIDGIAFRETVYLALYRDSYFPQVAALWQSLRSGDAATARRLAAEESPLPPQSDNNLSSKLAITCNDRAHPRSTAAYQREVEIDRARYPLFGPAMSNISPCAFWPRPTEPPVRVTPDGPSNILLLQNLRDPATPHVGGRLLRRAFGARARLVSVDQGGHGAYLYDDNPCGLNLTTRFLVDGHRPAADTRCPAGR